MGRSSIFLAGFLFFSVLSVAQENRYMVFFKDKSGTPYSVNNPSAFLTAKSIQRRENQNININEQDLPINPAYRTAVAGTGAVVYYATNWMNGVLVSCDASLIPTISSLPEVSFVEFVAPGLPANGGRQKSSKRKTGTHDEATTNQLVMIGIDAMHNDNLRGEGITIALCDIGFPGVDTTSPFSHIFADNRFDASVSFDFVHRSSDVFKFDDHGTRSLSIIGAFQEGDYTGGAYKANFQLFVTEDEPTEYRIEEYNWLFAAERADSAGVDIINSSVGYSTFDNSTMNYTPEQMDGVTPVVTRAAQLAADRGILVVASAGNEGNDPSWKVITAPADGVDVLAVGNVNGIGGRSSTSSIGPTGDGRIKPDVMALGSGVSVVRAAGNISTGSGTSFSAPLVVSLAAGLWQKYPSLTNKQLIEAIRQSASLALTPDNLMGYGIPNYTAVKNYLELQEQTELIAVFPNPVTNGLLTIRPVSPEEVPIVKYSLINIQGQILQRGEATFSWLNNQYIADVSSLAAGFYILQVQTGESLLTFRLVKL